VDRRYPGRQRADEDRADLRLTGISVVSPYFTGAVFSEENRAVAISRESQLLFHIHLLFVIFRRISATTVAVA
jgi:hypothetical protein